MNGMRLILIAAMALAAAAGNAQASGDPTQLIVTVKKVQLKKSGGDWITLGEPNRELDLMGEEASILSWKNDGTLPEGEYTNVKITLSETVKFAGSDGHSRSLEGGRIRLGGSATRAAEIPFMDITSLKVESPVCCGESAGLVTEVIDFDHEDRDDIMEIYGKQEFTKYVKIKKDSTVQVFLTLYLPETLHYVVSDYFSGLSHPEAIYFLPPKEVAEMSVRAGGTTSYASSDRIEWAF